MFFKKVILARQYAKMEKFRTGRMHVVVPCKKYLCPSKENFEKDYIEGFTVILHRALSFK